MIRNLMFGISLVTLTTASAFAAAPVHHAKAKVVAQAPAPEGAAPSTDKPVAKKSTKKAAAPKKGKGEVKGETKMDTKSDAKSGEIAPAPAAK